MTGRGPVEESGATVEEAIDAALARLDASEDEVEIRILSEGGGLPGSPEPARVLVKLRDERGPGDIEIEEDAAPPPPPEALQEQADVGADFLDELLDIMDLDVGLEIHVEGERALIELEGDEIGILIGRHGATLDALQDVTRAAVKNKLGDWPALDLDAEGYHARRRESLEQRARSVAAKVKRSGKPAELPPMTASERKMVHEVLVGFAGVRTESAGQGLDRHVVIHPA